MATLMTVEASLIVKQYNTSIIYNLLLYIKRLLPLKKKKDNFTPENI